MASGFNVLSCHHTKLAPGIFHNDENYLVWLNLSNTVNHCTAVCDSYHICIQRLQAVGVVGLPSLPRLQIFFLMFPIDPVAHCCICEVVGCIQITCRYLCTADRRIGTQHSSAKFLRQRSDMEVALVHKARSQVKNSSNYWQIPF